MAYCSLDQLTDRYGARLLIELSDRGEAPPEAPDADLFARAIADADALIDGYLFGRYALPVSDVPALLVDLSQRIAVYKAHANVVSDKIRKDYDDALKVLTQIADGKVTLNIAGAEPAGSGLSSGVTTNEPHRPLDADTMKGYI